MQKNPDLGFFLINMRSNSSIQTRITQEHHQAEGNTGSSSLCYPQLNPQGRSLSDELA